MRGRGFSDIGDLYALPGCEDAARTLWKYILADADAHGLTSVLLRCPPDHPLLHPEEMGYVRTETYLTVCVN